MKSHRAGEALDDAAQRQSFANCLTAALRFLSYRPRTVREVEQRLEGRFAPPVVDRTINYLKDLKYLDDVSFCAQWIGSRERLRPRGRRALRQELRRLGVEHNLVEESLEVIDETTSACNAIRKQANKLVAQGRTEKEFRQKLTPFLQRRGFGYGASKEAIDLLWSELQAN